MSLARKPIVSETVHTTDLARSAADLFVSEMLKSVHARGEFNVALSGGSTPLRLYARLAGMPQLPWEHTRVFWGDERFVPHDHQDSNCRNATRWLLDHVPVAPDRIHPWPQPSGIGSPRSQLAEAAAGYAAMLSAQLGPQPVFDLQLLGLGSDAHTASLYPGDPALHATTLTFGTAPPAVQHARLTLTPAALSNSRTVAFLISGEQKREALAGTLASDRPNPDYPASFVTALETRIFLADLVL